MIVNLGEQEVVVRMSEMEAIVGLIMLGVLLVALLVVLVRRRTAGPRREIERLIDESVRATTATRLQADAYSRQYLADVHEYIDDARERRE